MGYMGNPKTTSEVLTSDGWLRSGDLGYITEVGTNWVTDIVAALAVADLVGFI